MKKPPVPPPPVIPPERLNAEITLVLLLTTEEEARSFVIAAADIEAFPGTKSVRIVDQTAVIGMEPAPPWREGHPAPDSPWILTGVVIGPDADKIPDGHLPAQETAWAQAIMAILESYGMPEADKYEEEVFH